MTKPTDTQKTPKTPRDYAIEAQRRLFPAYLVKQVRPGEKIAPNSKYIEMWTTLTEIVLWVKMSILRPDPTIEIPPTEYLQEIREMFQARLDTWADSVIVGNWMTSKSAAIKEIDDGIREMVRGAILMIDTELSERQQGPTAA